VTLDTDHVMAGYRAGHLVQHTRRQMTGPVVPVMTAYVNVLAAWYLPLDRRLSDLGAHFVDDL
jgi:hypothetical protein